MFNAKTNVVTEDRILGATEPEHVFGPLEPMTGETRADLLRSAHQYFARCFHPDRNPKATIEQRKRATAVMTALNVLRGRAEEKIAAGTYGQASSIIIKAKFAYTDIVPLVAGDICDLYTASYQPSPGVTKKALLKMARVPSDADLLANEKRVLLDLHSKTGTEAVNFQRYLPRFIESTTVKTGSISRPVNVLSLTRNAFSLSEIQVANPNGIDAADMAWMWRRNLEILSWVHAQGYVHGAVLPSHMLVSQSTDPMSHFGRLVDWCYATKIGSRVKAISSTHRDFYAPEILAKEPVTPATDIYMSAFSVWMLIPPQHYVDVSKVPRRIIGLLRACMLQRPAARYTDVHDVYSELSAILKEVYGPPAFRVFAMPTRA